MSNLPSIQELYNGELAENKKHNQLNILLNQNPNEKWIKKHPIGGFKYLPIERIEWLLTSIFIKWKVEILESKLIANSVVVTVRLHFKDPVTSEWDCQDGIGAAPLQTDKGTGASDWNFIKNDAVMKAAPSAESFAVKDAADKIGKLFGKDLNRADQIMYDSLIDKFDKVDPNFKNMMDKLRSYSGKDKEEILELIRTKKFSGELNEKFMSEIINHIS